MKYCSLQQNKQLYQNEKDLDMYKKKLESLEVGCFMGSSLILTLLPSSNMICQTAAIRSLT